MNATAQTPPAHSEVVVIGGGIAGVAAAWFLERSGIEVCVCEKGRVAGEQSSRNWGWCRQQGRDEAELPIVRESLDLWQHIAGELDIDIGFRRAGCLYLCENDAEMAEHDDYLGYAAAHGVDSRRLNRAQLERLLTDCPRQWSSALYTANDARAEPSLAVPAMARALRARGVAVCEQCAVTGIETRNGAVHAVLTEHGPIRADAVLIAAGAWSTHLLRALGVRLPQLAVKASVARTVPAPEFFAGAAAGSGIAWRRRFDGGYTVALTDYAEIFPSTDLLRFGREFLPLLRAWGRKLRPRMPELSYAADYTRHRALDPTPNRAWARRLRRHIDALLPALDGVEFAATWSGMIDALPDMVPVLDRAAAIDGLWIATGFSGHGFGIGPAAGKIAAAQIRGDAVDHDLERFRLARFSDGSPLRLGPI